MKWTESILNLIPVYRAYKGVKNIKEHGLIEGYKKTLKDVYVENMPVVGHVYDLGKDEGKHEGMKEGYVRASSEYKKKLLKQAEEFLNQKNGSADSIKQLNKLLDEYEKCIGEMEAKYNSLTNEQHTILEEMKILKEKLKKYTLS
ncbi:MAG: hypothetical protein JJE30_03770 [Desulfuromonadales bacterium]|nr:hypothetical protein [Desulfuromonadales bacterium]